MGGGLSMDQLELIIAIAPTDAEREKLVFRPSGVYEGSTQAEAALAELGAIPLCRQRADALLLLETGAPAPRRGVGGRRPALQGLVAPSVVFQVSRASSPRCWAPRTRPGYQRRRASSSGRCWPSRARAPTARSATGGRCLILWSTCSRGGASGGRRCASPGPSPAGDVLVAARSRRRRRLEASKKVTLSDDDGESESEASSSSSDEDEDDGGLASPSQKRRHRRQRRDLRRAARWLPACFAEDPACAETVVSRRVVHGGLKQCAHRGEPNELAAVVSTLRRRVAAARAVARADRASQFEGEREAAVKAIASARAAEKRRLDGDRERAAKAAADARRALDAAGMKERAAMAREDHACIEGPHVPKASAGGEGGPRGPGRPLRGRARRGRLLRAHAHKVAAAQRNAPGLGREAQGPGRARSQDPGGPAGLRAAEQPTEVKRPKTKKHGSWRPPQA